MITDKMTETDWTIGHFFHELDENGYGHIVLDIQDHIHRDKNCCEDYIRHMPFKGDGSTEDEISQIVWSFIISIYGDSGVSSRTGWLYKENVESIDRIIAVFQLEYDWIDGLPYYIRTGLPVEIEENKPLDLTASSKYLVEF